MICRLATMSGRATANPAARDASELRRTALWYRPASTPACRLENIGITTWAIAPGTKRASARIWVAALNSAVWPGPSGRMNRSLKAAQVMGPTMGRRRGHGERKYDSALLPDAPKRHRNAPPSAQRRSHRLEHEHIDEGAEHGTTERALDAPAGGAEGRAHSHGENRDCGQPGQDPKLLHPADRCHLYAVYYRHQQEGAQIRM